jgi:four helix bundle protein
VPSYLDPEGFTEWEARLPASFKRDPIWRTPSYRYGVWLADLVKEDIRVLRTDPDYRNVAEQLLRAVEGISSNLAEGYSRSTGAERARYYGYSLATTRESRDWYFKARESLGPDLVERRLAILEPIVRILTAVVPRERGNRAHTRLRPKTTTDDGARADALLSDGAGESGTSS